MSTTPAPLDEAAIQRILMTHLPAVIPILPSWERWLKPAVSDAVDALIAAGRLDLATPETFDDIGNFASRVSADLFLACEAAGIPFPEGDD